MKAFYKLSNLSFQGRIILISLIILFFFGKIFIAEFIPKELTSQYLTVNGNCLKYDDTLQLSVFFNSIKSNNGYLCLGTSESSSLPNGNYYDFLNCDSTISEKFSVLAGAGRTCGMYESLIISHPHWFRDLKIIYMINPVYWRSDLSEFNLEYWNRYNNYEVCREALYNTNSSLSSFSINNYFNELNILNKAIGYTEFKLRNILKPFNQHLNYKLQPSKFEKCFTSFSSPKQNLQSFKSFGKVDLSEVDTIFNVLKSFQHKDWFKPINTQSSTRIQELKSFITIMKEVNAKVQYLICPVNNKFIRSYESSQMSIHEITVNSIDSILKCNNCNYLNMSEFSDTFGVFNDHQHYSSYGAFLIYLKLKKSLYEN